jgi:hypothetical protein
MRSSCSCRTPIESRCNACSTQIQTDLCWWCLASCTNPVVTVQHCLNLSVNTLHHNKTLLHESQGRFDAVCTVLDMPCGQSGCAVTILAGFILGKLGAQQQHAVQRCSFPRCTACLLFLELSSVHKNKASHLCACIHHVIAEHPAIHAENSWNLCSALADPICDSLCSLSEAWYVHGVQACRCTPLA